jgi:predicted DNA-binding protein (MmcQ/YjbR family)
MQSRASHGAELLVRVGVLPPRHNWRGSGTNCAESGRSHTHSDDSIRSIMDVDGLRRCCLSFPHATENVQWVSDLVFKVAGKMFAVTALEPGPHWLSLKCTPEEFAELVERPGIAPAPYLARAYWVAVERPDTLPAKELKRLLRQSYDLVVAKLPNRVLKKRRRPLPVGAARKTASGPRSQAADSRSSGKDRPTR